MRVWTVNPDGSLSSTSTDITGGALPWSATQVPGTSAYLAADGGLGYDIFDLASPNAGAKEHPVTGSGVICWSEYSAKTGNFYLSDFFAAAIDEVSVSKTLKGTFVNSYSTGQGAGNTDIRIGSLPNQPDHLYVLATNTSSVEVFALNGPGAAQHVQSMNIKSTIAGTIFPFQSVYIYGMDVWP
ncbi:hypothetical protein AX17_004933 [Amanita inopinata Kibby_2008]|nr:hypothetical protein AX17_004933 [Amanita inopinata Kibby_2008]